MDQIYEKITVVNLRAICKKHFRMSKLEMSSRPNIYRALERQPDNVTERIHTEATKLISEGYLRFSRNTANRLPAEMDDESGLAQRCLYQGPLEESQAKSDEPTETEIDRVSGEGPQTETVGEPTLSTGEDFMIAPDQTTIDDLLSNFVKATGSKAVDTRPCGACARSTSTNDGRTLEITKVPSPHRLVPRNPHPAHNIHRGMLLYPKAVTLDGSRVYICESCMAHLKRDAMPPLSLANDMWIGDIPYQLSGLSLAERIMISKGFPSAFIVKLYPKQKGASKWAVDQFHHGLKGNVSTYKMDPAQLANIVCPDIFPHPSSILSAVIGVTFVGPRGVKESSMPNTFRVRQWRVRDALAWLKANNPLYTDIQISEDMLAQLPEDGVPEEIMTTAKYSSDIDQLYREHEGYIPDHTDADHPEHVADQPSSNEAIDNATGEDITDIVNAEPQDEPVEPLTFPLQASGVIDITGEDITYSEMMAHALSNIGSSRVPCEDFTIRRGSAFINEYARTDPVTGERNDGGPSNPNHLLGTFPTLFPYGKGGFETGRTVKVPYETHVRWSLNYHDMRFRKDIHFPFQVFGVCQKREICKNASVQMNKTHFSRQMELISTIKPQDLIKASEEERRRIKFSNPAVRALRRNLTAIRSNVKGSDEARFKVRSKIWGMILAFNAPSLWITINPSDTQDPIAQVIAGVDIDLDAFCDTVGPTASQRATNVAGDPFSSAKFFHFVTKTIIEVLFGITKLKQGRIDRKIGIFGKVRGYVGTVEAQGRGTLHLHMMVWLQDAPTSIEMKCLLLDGKFRERVANYIKAVVRSDMDGMTTEEITCIQPSPSITYSRPMDPKTSTQEQRNEFERKLVRTLQLHSCSTRTCLRFIRGKYVCKRRAPFATAIRDWINEQGEWGSKRTCAFLNSWNPPIMHSVRSNGDIKLITNGPLTSKLTYYVTSYATKKQQNSSNVSALLAVELAFHKKMEKKNTDLRAINKRLIQRCANSLTKFREFSAPEVISYIMGWNDSYKSHSYATIFLEPIVAALKHDFPILTSDRSAAADALFTTETKSTLYITETSVGLKDQLRDYRYRGIGLSSMSLLDFILNTYEGEALSGSNATAENANEGGSRLRGVGRPPNSRHEYLSPAKKGSTVRVVRTQGHETLPRICGSWFSRSDKPSKVDLHRAEMLTLLTPWRTLSDIKSTGETFKARYDTLVRLANQRDLQFISNAQYYHECLDGAREAERLPENGFDAEMITAMEDGLNGEAASTREDDNHIITEDDIESARILRTKARERLYGEAAIDEAIEHGIFEESYAQQQTESVASIASFELLERITEWDKKLQEVGRLDYQTAHHPDVVDTLPSTTSSLIALVPDMVSHAESSALTHPSTVTLSELQTMDRPLPLRQKMSLLNKEQRRAHDIIEERLRQHMEGSAEQLLMLVLGAGGTGKSLLIGAITETFQYYGQQHILAKCATTGIAATDIGAQTLHSWGVLPVARPKEDDWVERGSNEGRSRRRKNISGKVFLIEDEVSMEDKALSYDASTAVSKIKGEEGWDGSGFKPYGGMHVIKFGDFHQFPPVKNPTGALYVDRPEEDNRKAKLGRNIFLQFNTVVILDQQVRATDSVWSDILGRIRIGQCSEEDIKEIRKLVLGNDDCDVPDFNTEPWSDAILVTPRHAVREMWNECSVKRHCVRTGRKRYIVSAEDFEKDSTEDLSMDARLAIASMKDKATGCLQDVIHIAVGMKTMVKINYAVEADIANGTRGRIEAVILDQRETPSEADNSADVYLKYPPALILFRPDRPTNIIFEGIQPGLIPITPSTASFKAKGKAGTYKILRRQFAMTPGYAFTDYKSQGQTIEYVIIDIGRPPTGSLSAFGIYVALSRSRGRKTIRLLRDFDESLFQHHPSEYLRKDMQRLEKLNEETKAMWKAKK